MPIYTFYNNEKIFELVKKSSFASWQLSAVMNEKEY